MIEQILHAYKSHDIQTIVTLLETSESRGTPALILTEQLIRTVRTRIVTEPELIPLLDSFSILLEVRGHGKLLTARARARSLAPLSILSRQLCQNKPLKFQQLQRPKSSHNRKTVSTSKPAVETKPRRSS